MTTRPTSFFRLPAEDFATLMRKWFPMAVHLLDGLYLGVRASEAPVHQREHLADLGTPVGQPRPRAQQPGGCRRPGHRAAARTASPGMRHKLG